MRLAAACLELDLLIKVDDAELRECATPCGFSPSSQPSHSILRAHGAAFQYSFSHTARPEQYRIRLARDLRAAVPTALATRFELDADVDRHRHIVAAQLEAGLIDETGAATVAYDYDREMAAFRDWRARHPNYMVPLPRSLTRG